MQLGLRETPDLAFYHRRDFNCGLEAVACAHRSGDYGTLWKCEQDALQNLCRIQGLGSRWLGFAHVEVEEDWHGGEGSRKDRKWISGCGSDVVIERCFGDGMLRGIWL